MHAELVARYGVQFPLPSDAEACPERLAPVGEQWRDTDLLVVGNLYANRAITPLYALDFCGCDSVYPGGDGYGLRTGYSFWAAALSVWPEANAQIEAITLARASERS